MNIDIGIIKCYRYIYKIDNTNLPIRAKQNFETCCSEKEVVKKNGGN